MPTRLDQKMMELGLVSSRSQAVTYIKLGQVLVDNKVDDKPGHKISDLSKIKILTDGQYVSRAALKLKSADKIFKLDFKDKVVLDVGSSTGGFTEYSIEKKAKKVIAVDVGTNQLDPKLRLNSRVELHEKTDIRVFSSNDIIDLILIDVSFISFKKISQVIYKLSNKNTVICFMAKPQFESSKNNLNSSGVIKNSSIRRKILYLF